MSGNACAEKGAGGCPRKWIAVDTSSIHRVSARSRFPPLLLRAGTPGGPGGPHPLWRQKLEAAPPPPHLPQPDSGHRAGSSRWTLSRHRAAEDCPASWSGPAFLTPCGPGSGLRGFCAVVLGVTPEGPAQNPPLQPPGLLSPPPHPRINPLPV